MGQPKRELAGDFTDEHVFDRLQWMYLRGGMPDGVRTKIVDEYRRLEKFEAPAAEKIELLARFAVVNCGLQAGAVQASVEGARRIVAGFPAFHDVSVPPEKKRPIRRLRVTDPPA